MDMKYKKNVITGCTIATISLVPQVATIFLLINPKHFYTYANVCVVLAIMWMMLFMYGLDICIQEKRDWSW